MVFLFPEDFDTLDNATASNIRESHHIHVKSFLSLQVWQCTLISDLLLLTVLVTDFWTSMFITSAVPLNKIARQFLVHGESCYVAQVNLEPSTYCLLSPEIKYLCCKNWHQIAFSLYVTVLEVEFQKNVFFLFLLIISLIAYFLSYVASHCFCGYSRSCQK